MGTPEVVESSCIRITFCWFATDGVEEESVVLYELSAHAGSWPDGVLERFESLEMYLSSMICVSSGDGKSLASVVAVRVPFLCLYIC